MAILLTEASFETYTNLIIINVLTQKKKHPSLSELQISHFSMTHGQSYASPKIILTIVKVKLTKPNPVQNEAPLVRVDKFLPSEEKLSDRNTYIPGGRNTFYRSFFP